MHDYQKYAAQFILTHSIAATFLEIYVFIIYFLRISFNKLLYMGKESKNEDRADMRHQSETADAFYIQKNRKILQFLIF